MDVAETVWAEIRVEISVPPEVDSSDDYLEPALTLVGAVAPDGYVQEGADAPPSDLPRLMPGEVRLRAYVDTADLERALARVSTLWQRYPDARIRVHGIDPNWKETWKLFFVGFEVSERLAVRPPWEESRFAHEVIIEPGLAFGTGHHETTRLCLGLIDRLYKDGEGPERLLDVGCGTGILSIAAAILGGGQIVGTDCDSAAVQIARENAETNGTAAACRFSTAPLEEVAGVFPVIVANIMAHILIRLCPGLVGKMAPGGRLFLSGVLVDQVESVTSAFVEAGLKRLDQQVDGEWTLLEFQER